MANNATVTLDPSLPPIGGMPRASAIPEALLASDLISPTSKAADCFVYQKFSAKLQAFLIGYTNSVYSYYSIYK